MKKYIYCKFKRCDPKLCERVNNVNFNDCFICVFEDIENVWHYLDIGHYTTTKSKFEHFGIFKYLRRFKYYYG